MPPPGNWPAPEVKLDWRDSSTERGISSGRKPGPWAGAHRPGLSPGRGTYESPSLYQDTTGYLMVLRMGDNAFAELTKLAKAENVPAASVTALGDKSHPYI